ncbi:gamma-glutamyltransferase [Thermocrispum municipale]|uniref:gamma-glutamyltransferase n=1 Tax=Thermocrispum municipale TaxID=37926 RepID=UPI000427BD98|nr:gamma-glutamyltransferase [Thermocrispum municipale]
MVSRRHFARGAAMVSICALTVGLVSQPAAADPKWAGPLTKEPVATGSGGAVATVDLEATRAGLSVLRKGGNAVDAAVAAAAVLGVTEPYSCGIGGGGFMMIYTAKDRKVHAIDHREKAPKAMQPDAFFEDGKVLPFDDARYSGRSVGVPGTVAGWEEALDRFGTKSLRQVLQPAISVARNGFEVDETFAEQTEDNREYFDDIPSSAKTFLDPDGTAPDVGSTFRNPELAKAYERIARYGAKGFYQGPIAEAMAKAVTNPPVSDDADHQWREGYMTTDDVKSYRADWREPTKVSYRGLDVYGMAPPSSGGSTVGEALNILEGYGLKWITREEALHYFLEASRYSFADRNAYVGDADFVDVPLQGLLSKDFAAERRALITGKAAGEVEPGDPWPHNGGGSGSGTPSVTLEKGTSTTHLTVADKHGNVVAYTFTIESTGGSGITVPGWGFLLNNELTDFNYDSTTHVNRVEGGKRPRSSMSPTIVLDHGKPKLAVGSPGGSTIITTVLQILVDRIDLGSSLPEAIAAPRATQRNGETTSAEQAWIDSPEAQALQERGHKFVDGGEIGAATGIEFLPGGKLLAAAEPERRGGGSAGVVRPW